MPRDVSGSAPRLRVVLEDANGVEQQLAYGPTPLDADSTREEPKAPAHGVRAESPGPRGCWALNKRGEPCGAARRADGDYCNAHSGIGIADGNPEWAVKGRAASAESRARRAALRLELGITQKASIRGMLRAGVFAERERVVASALSPLHDSDLGSAAKQRAALALLDAVEPQPKAALELPVDLNPEGVAQMGLSDLRALAERVAPHPSPLSPASS